MSVEENKAIIQRWIEEAWHKRNVAAVDEFFAPNFVGHDPSSEVRGIEGVKQYVTTHLNAFSDFHITTEDQIAEGDKVVTRFTVRGAHKGEYMGIAPTNKQVTWTGIFIARIADGQFVEVWQSFDELGLMQQIGAVPPIGQAVE